MRERGSILLVGVGGQGVVLASAVVADVALRAGFDVKQSEVHGMSQRGGVVSSHLRFGPEVFSPLIETGGADAVVAMEWNEGLRSLPALAPGAPLVVNLHRVVPPGACRDRHTGHWGYPAVVLETVVAQVGDVRACDALGLARAVGSAKAQNSVLLGVLSTLTPFPEAAWRASLAAHAPRGTAEANARAFEAGRALEFPRETFAQAARMGALPDGEAVHARAWPPAVAIDEGWCKGEACSICVRVCPERCLAIGPADRAVIAQPDACTGCRLCELLCPDFAVTVTEAAASRAR